MRLLVACFACLACAVAARAGLYQWSAAVGGEDRRAYLWIPEDCARLRGLVLDMKNLTEHALIEHPLVREACRRERVGIVWVSEDRTARGFARSAFSSGWGWPDSLPPERKKEYDRLLAAFKKNDVHPDAAQLKDRAAFLALRRELDAAAQKDFDAILADLADVSGFDEIRRAPLLVLSHSMGGHLCWGPMAMAYRMPERMWGVIPIKTGIGRDAPWEQPDATLSGIPLLYINQFAPEGPGGLPRPWRPDAPAETGRNPGGLIGQAFDWGGSHFEMNDDIAALVAMFIRKAAHYRLSDEIPADGPPRLKDLHPEQGWLASSPLGPDQAPPAPAPRYQGDPRRALWFFDEEMTRAALGLHAAERFKKPQYPAVVVNGIALAPRPDHFREMVIPLDSALDDGFTFKLGGGFQPVLPADKPGERLPVGHAAQGGAVVQLAGGDNLVQLDAETFRYRQFNRGPVGHGWLVATHPGDAEYARGNYPACIFFPRRLGAGRPQTLTFPPPPDVRVGTQSIMLHAASDVPGQVVEYYVVSGPAEITGDDPKYTGNILRFTPVPPGARFPVKVTVVAYQPGRSRDPLVQTAPEIVREFYLTR